jgi:SAM-dependent methyltransferase
MKLTQKIKQEIEREFKEFCDKMYAGKTIEERQELDQFFTPPVVTIQVLESLTNSRKDLVNMDILDPTCGSGNLLMACIIAGANPKRVFGNEFDPDIEQVCFDRLNTYSKEHFGVELDRWQIHRGDALYPELCLARDKFGPDYNNSFMFRNQISLF